MVKLSNIIGITILTILITILSACSNSYINKTIPIECNNTHNLTIRGYYTYYEYQWDCINNTLNLSYMSSPTLVFLTE